MALTEPPDGETRAAPTVEAGAPGPVPMTDPLSVTLDELYRHQYLAMVRLAHLITGSNEAAEDLVQEAFVRIQRSWHRAENPAAYLRTAVVNRCRTWQRRQVLERRHAQPPAPAEGASLPVEVDETLAALGRLAPRQRAALVLRFYADLSEADIASALGCRPGTVKSLIHRGLAELKETIER